MKQQIARIEKDYYRPKTRKFDKNSDTRWRVVYANPCRQGNKKESFSRLEDAQQRVKELSNLSQTTLQFQDWTVRDILELWETKRLIKLRSEKIERYKTRIIKEQLGDIKVSKFTEEHITGFKLWLERGRSVRTANAYLVTLRTAFNYARRKGVCSTFPDISEHVEASLEVKRDRSATPEEFESLLNACSIKKSGRDRMHLYPFLLWLHETACRTGELKKVQVRDIDLVRGVVRLWSGKSKRPVQRECGITPRLRNFILDSQTLERDGEELLFNTQTDWKRSFATACRIARIEGFRMHDLRRTGITNMLEKGIPLYLVAKMVGHSSGSILTLDVYTKFRSDFIQEMMAKMA